LELLTPFHHLFYCHFPINNNNSNNNSFQPQCQLSLRIPNHTTQPLTTLLWKVVGQILLPLTFIPLTTKGTSTHLPQKGTNIEPGTCHPFIFTYIPGLKEPIRARNPNYQASLNKPYYHRILTEAVQKALEEEAPKNHSSLHQTKGRRPSSFHQPAPGSRVLSHLRDHLCPF
jgi:hypothetical protein